MRTALLEDLAALRRHEIVTTTDIRFARPAPARVEVVTLALGDTATFDQLLTFADAVWLVAPETDRCLERLAARVERKGKILLGSGAAVIRKASDKAGLPRRLARVGVPHPETMTLESGVDVRILARELGYPVVVKPGRGAGSRGVSSRTMLGSCRAPLPFFDEARVRAPELGRQRKQVGDATLRARHTRERVAAGRRPGGAVALAINAQRMNTTSGFSYRGGRTPFDHPLAAAAVDAATRTCVALPGLRGYVGVDLGTDGHWSSCHRSEREVYDGVSGRARSAGRERGGDGAGRL